MNIFKKEAYIVQQKIIKDLAKNEVEGQPQWRSGLALPSAWGVILKTRDRVPRRALCMEPASLSLPLPVSLPLCHE